MNKTLETRIVELESQASNTTILVRELGLAFYNFMCRNDEATILEREGKVRAARDRLALAVARATGRDLRYARHLLSLAAVMLGETPPPMTAMWAPGGEAVPSDDPL